jgi:hypothetical protein
MPILPNTIKTEEQQNDVTNIIVQKLSRVNELCQQIVFS